jgi:flavin reductase (DIM6/NTAB) family NADH-FMN oxidoreductase RutF
MIQSFLSPGLTKHPRETTFAIGYVYHKAFSLSIPPSPGIRITATIARVVGPQGRPSLGVLLRRASGFLPTSVSVLLGGDEQMTVSTLQCVSFDPPWVSVCLECGSRKGQAIRQAGRFRARVLRAEQVALARGGATFSPEPAGLVELTCVVARSERVGDHHLVLAEVTEVAFGQGRPLVYWRGGFQNLRPEYPCVATREAFQDFVDAWERTSLPRSQWSHAGHVALGACYAVRYGEGAMAKTRDGIRRFNVATGTANTAMSGYHETLTRFWATVIAQATQEFTDEWLAARHAVERYGEDRDLHRLFYSFDVVRNVVARHTWIAPDLAGDDFALSAVGPEQERSGLRPAAADEQSDRR